jgi:hypothetical protein
MAREGRVGFGNKTPKIELKILDKVVIAKTEKGKKFETRLKEIGVQPSSQNFGLKITAIEGRRIILWDEGTRKFVKLDLSTGDRVSEYLVKKK